MSFRDMIKPDMVDVVAPGGAVRCRVEAFYAGGSFLVEDPKADIRAGDEIRRKLPNGNEEAFTVLDPRFYADADGSDAHYQVKIKRPEIHAPHTGGNYTIQVTGANSRVNVNSTDQSTNVVSTTNVFDQLRGRLAEGVGDRAERAALMAAVDELQDAKDEAGRLSAYQALIANAANHMTLLAPFLHPLLQATGLTT